MLQILLAKELSNQDGNQRYSNHQNIAPEVQTNDLVDLGNKETVYDIPSAQYNNVFQDNVKEQAISVPRAYHEDKTIKSEHLSAEKPLPNQNRPLIAERYPSLFGLSRKSRDLDHVDGYHEKQKDISETETDGDVVTRKTTRLDTTVKDPMVEFTDTVFNHVNTSGKRQTTIRGQVAVREKRSQNCPASPDGEVSFTGFD